MPYPYSTLSASPGPGWVEETMSVHVKFSRFRSFAVAGIALLATAGLVGEPTVSAWAQTSYYPQQTAPNYSYQQPTTQTPGYSYQQPYGSSSYPSYPTQAPAYQGGYSYNPYWSGSAWSPYYSAWSPYYSASWGWPGWGGWWGWPGWSTAGWPGWGWGWGWGGGGWGRGCWNCGFRGGFARAGFHGGWGGGHGGGWGGGHGGGGGHR